MRKPGIRLTRGIVRNKFKAFVHDLFKAQYGPTMETAVAADTVTGKLSTSWVHPPQLAIYPPDSIKTDTPGYVNNRRNRRRMAREQARVIMNRRGGK